MRRFAIVGTGRVGTALGAALVRAGWQAEALVDTDARAARESRRLIGAGRASTALTAAAKAKGTVVIAVPDGAVAAVAAGLARAGGAWTGRAVFHTSGLLTSAALRPLAARGARVASLHPVQSFPRKDLPASVFRGITWGIEGDLEAVEAAAAIVGALVGRILLLSAAGKARYHAACALASNALVALEWTAAELLKGVGAAEEVAALTLLPLAQGTLQNVKSLGLERALTGPIARGDVDTVRRHLEALEAEPAARLVYKALGRQTLRLAVARGLAAGKVRSLKRLLEGR
jgi:predicted short-subunit dehydrogenase-like oxidoreductase (DUF2520 family)